MTDLVVAVATGTPPTGWRFLPPSPRIVTVEQPAAGQGWSWTAPQGRLLRLAAVHCTLTTSATAGSRRAILHVVGPTEAALMDTYVGAITALSSVAHLTWLAGGASEGATAAYPSQCLGGNVLPPLCTVSMSVLTVAATDQVSNVALLVNLV